MRQAALIALFFASTISVAAATAVDSKEDKGDVAAGYSAIKTGDLDSAISDFTHAMMQPEITTTERINILNRRGLLYVQTKQFDLAYADFSTAIELSPKESWAYANRCYAEGFLKKYQEALTDCTQSLELGPVTAFALRRRGIALTHLKRLDEAIADFDAALKIQPAEKQTLVLRGYARAEKGDYAGAISDYGLAINLKPDYAPTYQSRAIAFERLRRYDEAIADLDKAIDLEPETLSAYRRRGAIYELLGRLHEAQSDFDTAISKDPKLAWNYAARATLRRVMGQTAEADADLSEAIRLKPDNSWFLQERGRYRLFDRRYKDATNDFETAAKLVAGDSYIRVWLHIARIRNGEDDRIRLADDTIKLDMNSWPAPIVSLFLGRQDDRQVLDAANVGETTIASEHACEATFFLGEKASLEQNEAAAERLFQSALAMCPSDFVEHRAAQEELRRVARPTKPN
jgi:tetratricopeptide (TPR) repeat protein